MAGGQIGFDGPPTEFLEWDLARGGSLSTPLARLFGQAGLAPPPASVKQARDALAAAGWRASVAAGIEDPAQPRRTRRARTGHAVRARGVWMEIERGPAILTGVDLEISPGEVVGLMGRNGAGKSTLLRLLRGLTEPTRGRVERGGEVALLLQHPGDYLIHDHVADEAGSDALELAGLADRAAANPRDLSGGERQRLALEIVLDGGSCAAVCLDEPTRGMDRLRKEALASRLRDLAATGTAVIVATHDTEFAALFADRVVLMGPGVVIADGTPAEILAGGWHFSTEVARTLDGAGGALTPEQGARVIGRELVA
jgi:energy-coupling factor transport system ATP-binding protein